MYDPLLTDPSTAGARRACGSRRPAVVPSKSHAI